MFNYDAKAKFQAVIAAELFSDSIVRMLASTNTAGRNVLIDYGDEGDDYMRDTFLHKSERRYTLVEGTDILKSLHTHISEDPEDIYTLGISGAISAAASHTFANAVAHYFKLFVDDVVSDFNRTCGIGNKNVHEKVDVAERIVKSTANLWKNEYFIYA